MSYYNDEELSHFGTRGMHWGVRKGKGTTGVSRRRGTLIDRNDRMIRNIKNTRSGKSHKVLAAVGRKIVGEEKQKQNWNKQIKTLNAQNDRVKSGKLKVEDRASVYFTTNVLDLVVSRRPT